jgi:radical SAM-linked protein
MKAQRLRVTFSRGEPLRFISHLDLMRFWERALRRGGLSVAYSEGFSPHPKLSLGAPLPVGTTGEAELMDVVLAQPVEPEEFLRRVRPQLPPGVAVSDAREAPASLPSIQSQLRAAEYRVVLPEGTNAERRVRRWLTFWRRSRCRGNIGGRRRSSGMTSARWWNGYG